MTLTWQLGGSYSADGGFRYKTCQSDNDNGSYRLERYKSKMTFISTDCISASSLEGNVCDVEAFIRERTFLPAGVTVFTQVKIWIVSSPLVFSLWAGATSAPLVPKCVFTGKHPGANVWFCVTFFLNYLWLLECLWCPLLEYFEELKEENVFSSMVI